MGVLASRWREGGVAELLATRLGGVEVQRIYHRRAK
jgi:hypothetical protein